MLAKTKCSLDFNQLPHLSHYTAIFELPVSIASVLQHYPNTYDRALGALYFTLQIGKESTSTIKLRESYMRAAIAEYVSMEETIDVDAKKTDFYKIVNSKNPLLHIVKQLRNMQIHILTSKLESTTESVTYCGHEFEMQFWSVQAITPNDFDKLRYKDRYMLVDKVKMIEWFNKNQLEWGIQEIILQAILSYARELAFQLKASSEFGAI
mgnify:CR=1 FL=1